MVHIDKTIYGYFLPQSWIHHKSYSGYLWYATIHMLLPFYFWGAYLVVCRIRANKQFQGFMENSGLKSPLGKFPALIKNVPVNEECRKLVIKKNGIPLEAFREKKGWIESNMEISIEAMSDRVHDGCLEIVYSNIPLTKSIKLLSEIDSIPAGKILIGKSRAKTIYADFKDYPHFLVAGSTGSGKSTFLRNLIFTLIYKEKDIKFKIIDLKGGLEFQNLFHDIDNVRVISSMSIACAALMHLSEDINYRIEYLKNEKLTDISEYFKKFSLEERKTKDLKLAYREVIVIDEAAELYLSSQNPKEESIKTSKAMLNRIARLGRAVGIHIVLATQRPDVSALDPQVKANLSGVVCFRAGNVASSMVIIGNKRASEISAEIPGRAVWKTDNDLLEVQTPFISTDEIYKKLTDARIIQPRKDEAMNDQI
ncbi:MAG: DUF87 domain-containing protein [Xanthomonadaceae bacterium]|nr:DUF87 domain-containing protein [Xanthomonadaceae bacterium]